MMYASALVKIVMGIAGTVILDALCGVDLGIVSWAIVATPFLMVALAGSITMGLGMDRLLYEKFTLQDSANPSKQDGDALPISTASTY